jgi:hypothetical protein
MRRVLLTGAAYFASVFVAAFALGAVRTFLVEPRVGEIWAVALEAPFLVGAMYLSARFMIPRLRPPSSAAALLAVGLFGLLLQQAAEMALIFAAGETLQSHLAYLTTIAGMIYLATLCVFVILPLALWRGRTW